MLANICAPKRGSDKRLFYRRHASLSFYTAKGHKRTRAIHWPATLQTQPCKIVSNQLLFDERAPFLSPGIRTENEAI
jgi:hypothetical protein